MNKKLSLIAAVMVAAAAMWVTMSPTVAKNPTITKSEVLAMQDAWGKALVSISETNKKEGIESAKKLAENVLDTAYGYNLGPVLFKPTLTVAPQTFRTTKEGALAYFVGHNKKFPDDKGFALNNWKSVKFNNAGINTYGNTAIAIGKVEITNADGKVTEVDKTMGFVKDSDGKLRIVLHHSSLPYTAN